ncbi:MAG: hypothetical protein JST06_09160 [Bacteroidetes bacterium]|nr:hypothetical protein [Bacteroidota bacterium]MBS1630630.1 hypothetical protein [Bacteroidota bacterium]
MKHFIYALSFGTILCMASQPASATIWRLNNSNGGTITPNINASFSVGTTLQQAHDNSSVNNGDTIHVEQSNTSYGNLTMTKRLTIIGVGYFLAMNPKTQVNTATASIVGSINMNASTCAGSTITGLTIQGTVYMGASRLLVTRNYIALGSYTNGILVGGTGTTAVDSTIITQNFISVSSYSNAIAEQSGTGNLTNLYIANNYLYANNYGSVNTSGRISGIIKNNVMDAAYTQVQNMYVVNNIDNRGVTNYFNNCLIEYNIGKVSASFASPSGSGNTFTGSTNLTNTSLGFVTASSTDSSFMLSSSSPAKGTGKSGDDMGMFGGSLPYKLSGIPTVPNVYALSIGTVAAGATSISVTVSTKSN